MMTDSIMGNTKKEHESICSSEILRQMLLAPPRGIYQDKHCTNMKLLRYSLSKRIKDTMNFDSTFCVIHSM